MPQKFSSNIATELQNVPARRLLAAMTDKTFLSANRTAPRGMVDALGGDHFTLARALRQAEQEIDEAGDLGLTVSFKEIVLHEVSAGGLDWGRGEVYVVTSILDGSGKQPEFKTQLFEGIHDGDRLPLGGGGMLVGMLKNPRWFIDVHMVIMESDSDIRRIGKAIETARNEAGLRDIVEKVGQLAAFDPTAITTITFAVDKFLLALSSILSQNGDDHLATVHDFYLKHQAFGSGRHPASGLARFQEADVAYQMDLVKL